MARELPQTSPEEQAALQDVLLVTDKVLRGTGLQMTTGQIGEVAQTVYQMHGLGELDLQEIDLEKSLYSQEPNAAEEPALTTTTGLTLRRAHDHYVDASFLPNASEDKVAQFYDPFETGEAMVNAMEMLRKGELRRNAQVTISSGAKVSDLTPIHGPGFPAHPFEEEEGEEQTPSISSVSGWPEHTLATGILVPDMIIPQRPEEPKIVSETRRRKATQASDVQEPSPSGKAEDTQEGESKEWRSRTLSPDEYESILADLVLLAQASSVGEEYQNFFPQVLALFEKEGSQMQLHKRVANKFAFNMNLVRQFIVDGISIQEVHDKLVAEEHADLTQPALYRRLYSVLNLLRDKLPEEEKNKYPEFTQYQLGTIKYNQDEKKSND